MGFTRATQTQTQQVNPEAPPWHLESGTYPARPVSMTIVSGDKGATIFRLSLIPQSDKAPSPLDLPRVDMDFDTSTDEGRQDLYYVMGEPAPNPQNPKTVKWPGSVLQWNGETGDSCRFAGDCEITIVARPPRWQPKRGDFPAKWGVAYYTVTLIDKAGSSQETARAAQLALLQPAAPKSDAPAPVPTTKKGR